MLIFCIKYGQFRIPGYFYKPFLFKTKKLYEHTGTTKDAIPTPTPVNNLPKYNIRGLSA